MCRQTRRDPRKLKEGKGLPCGVEHDSLQLGLANLAVGPVAQCHNMESLWSCATMGVEGSSIKKDKNSMQSNGLCPTQAEAIWSFYSSTSILDRTMLGLVADPITAPSLLSLGTASNVSARTSERSLDHFYRFSLGSQRLSL